MKPKRRENMTKNIVQHFRRAGVSIAVCVVAFVFMLVVSACAGVTNANGTTNVTGPVVSVNAQQHSVSLNVNGQTITISGLTDSEIAQLQSVLSSHLNTNFSFNVTQNSDGSYTISTDPNSMTEDNTPGANNNETPNANEPGSISFIGTVKSVSNGSIVVSLPDGSTLSMVIVNGQTDLSDFNGALPSVNQLIKVDATANTDGSFLASQLKPTDSGDVQDENTVEFDGVTTSAVGSDHVINFRVGNKSLSYGIASTADLSDFNGNAQAIGNNVSVKVKVQFQRNTGTVIKVSNAHD
jgi:hypothetical protein